MSRAAAGWDMTSTGQSERILLQPAQEADSGPNNVVDQSLIHRIRAEFRRCVRASNSLLGPGELARYWYDLAEDGRSRRGQSKLSIAEKQAIALRVAQAFQEMNLKGTGQVCMEEWVHYMLITHSDFAGKQVNSLLSLALRKNKRILNDLQDMFERADLTKSGSLSVKEIVEMYSKKLWHLRPGSNACPLTDAELAACDPEKYAREIVQMMDLNGDEQITYPEFMAYCLGRRKQEVTLHLYDLSSGAAEAAAPYLVGTKLEGIWHTGVVAFGKEYYYAKDTVFDEPGATSFGEPTRILHLGYTLWRQEELHEYVVNELKPVFHRDTYDVVANNCNHFSDRVCMFLLGSHVPNEVLQQPDLLLKSRFVRVLRPLLNWWLRDRVAAREKGKDLPPGRPRLRRGERPTAGTVVTIHPAEGYNGVPVLARVKDRVADGDGTFTSRGWLQLWDSCAVHASRAVAGCGGGLPSPEDGGSDCLSVQYFDVQPSSTGGGFFHAEVYTETVPHGRISLADVGNTTTEVAYVAAMKAMGVPSELSSSLASGQPPGADVAFRTSQTQRGGSLSKDTPIDAPTAAGPSVPGRLLLPRTISASEGPELPLIVCEDVEDMGSGPKMLAARAGARSSDDRVEALEELATTAKLLAAPAGAKANHERSDALEALVGRGFGREAAAAALNSADWCEEKALRMLLLGPGRDGDGRVSQL